ncbi:GumC family protein [Alistipes timonensis]|uniref:GumC family protein n=1 Tax=Alistipes timonensis TaxID=1465754 RepID=UPI00242F391D|nr:tyrosine-protein kinase family protein [Alistipes timonensis]
MTEQQINSPQQQGNDEMTGAVTLHDIIRMVIANWYWFVLSALVCLSLAYYYLASTPKIYSRTATILVKDSRKGGDLELTAFSDLAGFQNRRSVDNEVFILQSRRLMTEVVKRLDLTVSYSVRERLRRRDLYAQSPVEVTFVNDSDNQSLSMEITPLEGDKVRLTNFEDRFVTKQETRSSITAAYGDTIPTPVGQVVVRKSLYMKPEYTGVPIRVVKNSLSRTTNAYRNAVKSDVANKQASVVTISMNNSVPRRAEDILNTLISVYNEDAIDDKRRVSVTTAEFIKARLAVIGRELGDVDRDIEDIKKDNQMVDITSEAARSVSESSKYKAEGLSLENQINVAEFIRTYLNDPKNAGELIPMMASVTNQGISSQIADYNNAILRREKLMENSSDRSPVIQDLDNLLASVRRSIVASLDSHISTLIIQRDAMRKEETQANRRISTMPSQEKVILGITRQQKIKEELFLYLLNKQEETQLNYAVAESNARIIDLAYGNTLPVSPRPMLILAIALIVGLAIPFGLLYLIGMLDTTIRGRKDVEDNISAPFLGDIPYSEGGAGGDSGIVVRETGRDALSEAFRMLRSSMTFMNVSAGNEIHTILFTSSDPHAGKTFVATNLATTLAMAGKRVLLIDLDLRRHALSSQLGHGNCKTGITSYLAGTTGLDKLIAKTGFHDNLDVIYAGIQPPNPTEMLLSNKLDKMMAELREKYAYIFIDSTPAMSVADAIITDRLSDLCIYIVREGVLDRRQLPDIERLYREKKLHNMAIVLNGTRSRRHGYGYGYGYGYGHGYGYGYGDEYKEVSYRKRIKSFFRSLSHKIKR